MQTAQINAFRVPKPQNNDFKFKPKSIHSPQLMPPMHPFHRSDTNDEQGKRILQVSVEIQILLCNTILLQVFISNQV